MQFLSEVDDRGTPSATVTPTSNTTKQVHCVSHMQCIYRLPLYNPVRCFDVSIDQPWRGASTRRHLQLQPRLFFPEWRPCTQQQTNQTAKACASFPPPPNQIGTTQSTSGARSLAGCTVATALHAKTSARKQTREEISLRTAVAVVHLWDLNYM